MTPLQQRGYDDQRAGALDPALMADDGPSGREYRDGTREARRDVHDAGEAPHAARPVTADMLAPAEPPPVELGPAPAAPTVDAAKFQDKPAPKKRAKPADAQLDLF